MSEANAAVAPGRGPVEPGAHTYRDATRTAEERAQDLLGRMTLSEKIAQLGSRWAFELLDGEGLDPTSAAELLAEGVGQITRVAGATNLPPMRVAELGDAIQRYLVEETRLGIPAILHEESLHGVMARDAVCFPQAIGLAASWDPALAGRMAERIGHHLRTIGASQALAPVLDITRDPRWGRLEETYGEDPYLAAAIGCAYVRGVQQTPPDERPVIATGKHMVGHGLPEGGLNQAPAHIGSRELADTFLFPFEAAVRDADIGSVMHAYDDIDGVPCVASRELLTSILRERWGFDGLVVADYLGIEHLLTLHQLVDDLGDAAAMTLTAGLDQELPRTAAYGEPLRLALEDGRIDLALVDRAVERVLRTKFRLGLFERPYAPRRARVEREADLGTALDVARRSLVLLENDGVLPLRAGLGSIAVIGPAAEDARVLVGDYGHIAHIETLLENRGREGVAGNSAPLHLQLADELGSWETVLTAIRRRAPATMAVHHERGCGILGGEDEELEAAARAARSADVAVLVLGEQSGLTAECTCGETRDRMHLGLPGRQAELFRAVAATGTPVVLVLVAGRPLAIPDEAARAAAVIHAWVPGEAGPRAIAETLFGDVSPGGKLPVTVPRHVGQVPVYYGHKPSGGRSQWHEDYVDGSHLPLWPFGFGRSYSSFALSGLRLDRDTVAIDGTVAVSLEVTNVGERAADEVVQLYLRDIHATVTRPLKELRGFARVTLEPGASTIITFGLAVEQLAFTGVDGELRIEPGHHRVMVGTSSADLPLEGGFEVIGEVRTLRARSRFFSNVEIG